MGLRDDVDPWKKIEELEEENRDLRSEIQFAHTVLDELEADSELGRKELTKGPQDTDHRLPARLIRFTTKRVCPLGRIR
jgi:hypothetical protein